MRDAEYRAERDVDHASVAHGGDALTREPFDDRVDGFVDPRPKDLGAARKKDNANRRRFPPFRERESELGPMPFG